jgi:hypothetical protein
MSDLVWAIKNGDLGEKEKKDRTLELGGVSWEGQLLTHHGSHMSDMTDIILSLTHTFLGEDSPNAP